MNTAKANIVESMPKRGLHGLPSRLQKAPATARLERIRKMAGALLQEAESLDREQGLAEALAAPNGLDLESGIDFFDEVRRFETRLIKLALNRCDGNQARAARLLRLGNTTLNYKIKSYEIA